MNLTIHEFRRKRRWAILLSDPTPDELAGGWFARRWIGPYDRKAEAERDLRGLTKFFQKYRTDPLA